MDITRAVYTLYRVMPNYGYTCIYDFLCMAWLSLHLAKQHYKEIAVYCDSESKKVLEELGLDVGFEERPLKNKVWTEPKIRTYQEQTVPFIHLDFDVFLWKKPKEFQGMLYQNIEHESHRSLAYIAGCDALETHPECWPRQAANFGVFGTTVPDKVTTACNKTLDFIERCTFPQKEWKTVGLVIEQLILRNLIDSEDNYVLGLKGHETLEDIEKLCLDAGYTHLFDRSKTDNRNRFFIERAVEKIDPNRLKRFKEINYSGEYGSPFDLESRNPVYKRLGLRDGR